MFVLILFHLFSNYFYHEKFYKVGKTPKTKFHTAPVQKKKKIASFILATCVYLLCIIVCYLHTIISIYI